MLTSFEIERFRTFDRLQLQGLGNVNLVVGRNNVGKTVVLEALRLYSTRGHPLTIYGLLSDREEFDRTVSDEERRDGAQLNLSALLHGRSPQNASDPSIHLGPIDAPAERLTIRFGLSNLETTDDGRQVKFAQFSAEQLEPLALSIAVGGKEPVVVDEDLFLRLRRMYRPGMPSSLSLPKLEGPAFVPAGRILETQVTSWWDSISLTDAEQRVIECLRIVSPIEKIALVQHPIRERSRIVLVKLEGEQEPVPLGALGEGLRRMFGISLAMENARDSKLLLVDEVENGIHYTALPNLWRFVGRAAQMHGVQVFATTHSWDCVEAFQQATTANPMANGVLVRLQQRQGRIEPTLFSKDELRIVTRDRIEVR